MRHTVRFITKEFHSVVLISCISYFPMAMIKYLTKETSEKRHHLGSQFEGVVYHHGREDVLARVALTARAAETKSR